MNVNKYNNEFVRNNLNETDVLLQLAEEAGELAQAAAKKARILLGNNPTPVTPHQADIDLLGEFADVLVCYSTLFSGTKDQQVLCEANRKLERWVTRLGGVPHHVPTVEENKYYTKDNVLIKVGSSYFGESDGAIWTVIRLLPKNNSHVVQASNVRLGTKELKPKWLLANPRVRNIKHSPKNSSGFYYGTETTPVPTFKLNQKPTRECVVPLVYKQD